jgi:hypothetical protein
VDAGEANEVFEGEYGGRVKFEKGGDCSIL